MRSLYLLLISFLVGSTSIASPTRLYSITHLLNSPQDEIALIDGTLIRPKSPLSSSTALQFLDKYPGANWAHPAEIQVLEGNTVKERIPVHFPPQGLRPTDQISGYDFTIAKEATFTLTDFGGKYHVKSPENFYALLINGRAEQRHWNDFSFLYRTLTKVYGYDKSRIFVADSAFRLKKPDLDNDGVADINYESSIKGIKFLISTLKTKLSPKDFLFVAINDHGVLSNNEAALLLDDGILTASDYGKLMRHLPAKYMLSLFEQCFGGGFVRPSVSTRRVAMAASTDVEFSWASMDMQFNEFFYHVVTAFAGQNHKGKLVNADKSRDGRISAQEAFSYAIAHDRRRESPLLESGINAGMAPRLGMGFHP